MSPIVFDFYLKPAQRAEAIGKNFWLTCFAT